MRTRHRLVAALTSTAALLAAGLVAGVAAPAQAAAPNSVVVGRWYDTFLGRDADAGSAYWSAQLDAGRAPAAVLDDLLHTEEYVEQQVDYYYRIHLHRDLDPGAQYWVQGVAHQGMSMEWVEQNILASDEYAYEYGRGTGGKYAIVSPWYLAVVGRVPVSDGEVTYWGNQIDTRSRLDIIRSMYYADESVAHRIQENYDGILRREADPGGLSYWRTQEVTSDVGLQVALATTPEYLDR